MLENVINLLHRRRNGPKPAACPHCGSDDLVPIVYGLPDSTMSDAASKNEISLGGCVVMLGHSPAWYCRACRKESGVVRE
jgi:hypothetical protein